MLHTVVALLQVAGGLALRHDVPVQKAAEIVERVAAAELQFLADWNDAWRASELQRHPVTATNHGHSLPPRFTYLHCFPPLGGQARVRTEIASAAPAVAVCPTWVFDNHSSGDERMRIDDALAPNKRIEIARKRSALISVLHDAAAALPAHDDIIGQLVRFLIDAGEATSAREAARACGASQWWCAALNGYAYAMSGGIGQADSAFRQAARLLDPSQRCVWLDIAPLLERTEQQEYGRLPCDERERLNDIAWWLARPLMSEPGNSRRVEQFVRAMMIALRAPWAADERWDLRSISGGDAKKEMITRYGWPSLVYWGGYPDDLLHHRIGLRNTSWTGAPFATFEYSIGRLHLVPAWNAILNPLAATSNDFRVDQPNQIRLDDRDWWTREHFQPSAPIVQIPDGQLALLRRDTTTLVAIATEFPERTAYSRAKPAQIMLLTSHAPDSIRTIGRTEAAPGIPIRVWGEMNADPSVVGIEFAGTAGNPAGRWRSTIAEPRTLRSLSGGELAVSDPVLLSVAESPSVVATPAQALATMAPTTTFALGTKLTLYWETYGATSSDTVEVGVWIERYTPQGLFRRIGIVLGTQPDLNTPVVTTWRESRAPEGAVLLGSTVPVIGRTTALDVSALPPGEYWLAVSVARPGQAAVRGQRSITLR